MLSELGDETKVLAGGQSLVPMLSLRLASSTTWSTSAASTISGASSARREPADRRRTTDAAVERDAEVPARRPAAGPGDAAHRSLPDPQPGHGGRLDRPRRPGGGVPGRGAGARRRDGGRCRRRAHGPSPRPTSSPGSGRPRWPTTSCSPASRSRSGRAAAVSPSRSSPGATATSPSPARWSASSSTPTTVSSAAPSACSASARRHAGHRGGGGGRRRRRRSRRPRRARPRRLAALDEVPPDLHGSADYRRRVGAALVSRASRRAVEEARVAEIPIEVQVNGRPAGRTVEPRLTLADFLRERCHLTGTHLGCEHGVCGACTVLARRRGRPRLPHVRRAGRRRRGHDDRGPRRPRRRAVPVQAAFRTTTACSAASAPRASSCRSPRSSATTRPERRRDPRRPVRQPLPLHRLPGHPQGDPGRRRRDRPGRRLTTSTVRLAPVGDWKSTLSPGLRPSERLTERRPGADDVVLDAALLDGAEEVEVGVVVALVAELHDAPGLDRRRRSAPSTISAFSSMAASCRIRASIWPWWSLAAW